MKKTSKIIAQSATILLMAIAMFVIISDHFGSILAFTMASMVIVIGFSAREAGVLGTYNCSAQLGDLGVNCFTMMKKAQKLYFVPYYNSLGVINSITLTPGTYTDTFFKALINQTDPSKRWYPTPLLRDANQTREASISKKYGDNSIVIVQKGVKSFKATIAAEDGAYPYLLGQLLKNRNAQFGMFVVDIDGNLWGAQNVAGSLAPIKIDQNSIDPIFNEGTDTTPTELMMQFNIASTEIDANIAGLDATIDIDPSAQLLLYNGLLAINPVFSNLTHAGNNLTIAMNEFFGSAGSPTAATGLAAVLIAANLTVVTLTGTAPTGTITATEILDTNGIPTGKYTLVFGTAATGACTFKLQVNANAIPGFDWGVFNNTVITLT